MKELMKKEDDAMVGIGTMIVFIAMILVAAVAASVLIDTSNALEWRAKSTSSDTLKEVSSGIKILDVCGQYGTRIVDGSSYSRIHNLTITMNLRAGSKELDLSETLLVITNGDQEYVLRTNSTLPVIANRSRSDTLFNMVPENHPELSTVFDLPSSEFGIIVVRDHDGSCTSTLPGVNKGDIITLTVNLTALFDGVSERTKIWGRIVPEEGGPGIFDFRTPSCFTDTIIDLK